jgi:hypothetical protein
MRVVIPEVVVPLRAREAGEKLQLLSEGKPEHAAGDRLNVPLKPFIAVNVSVVEPLLPGLETMIVCGFAVMEKSGAAVTVCGADPVELA